MKMKKNKKIGADVVGGTIVVPNNIDPLSISCRSDLTEDLADGYGDHDYHDDDDNTPSPPTVQQTTDYVRKDSSSTFHTATSSASAAVAPVGQIKNIMLQELERQQILSPIADDEEESNAEELDKIAEQAAFSCFGVDADKPMDDSNGDDTDRPRRASGPRRRSSLVASNSSIDVSWFASRGLMSRRSFERYQEEMKSKVLKGVTSSNSLRRRGKKNVPNRASLSMCDLRNQEWPEIRRDGKFPTPLPPNNTRENSTSSVLSSKPSSVDEGLKNLLMTNESSHSDSSDHLDDLLLSLRSSFQQGDVRSSIKQVKAAYKMIKRLSEDHDDVSPLSQADALSLAAIRRKSNAQQNEILNDATKYCSSDDLVQDDDVNLVPAKWNDYRLRSNTKCDDKLQTSEHSMVSAETTKMGCKDSTIVKVGYKPIRSPSRNQLQTKVHEVEFNSSTDEFHTLMEDSLRTLGSYDPSLSSSLAVGAASIKSKIEERSVNTTPSPDTQMDEREDSDGMVIGLPVPELDRGTSTISVTTSCALDSSDLVREDESLSTKGTMAAKDKSKRDESTRTDCAVDVARRMPKKVAEKANCGPVRRLSSPASIPKLRRNSFSSLFTVDPVNHLEGPPLKESGGDILQEGMEYLSMALLVSAYGKLRELSLLGHTSVKLIDIDVNSHQRNARRKEMLRRGMTLPQDDPYLMNTKTAGSIVLNVLDEYELSKAEYLRGAGNINRAVLNYDASFLKDFNTLVEESKVKVVDSVTESVIKKLRRSDSSPTVRGSITKRRNSLMSQSDSFQNANILAQEKIIIKDVLSRRLSTANLRDSFIEETLEKEAKEYFEVGSSLRNLLDIGIEVVFFSDRHIDDIIYCVCINRATSTVNVVFRGKEGLFGLLKDTAVSSYANPLKHEDYEGNSEVINLRSKVTDELLRVRRDTKKSNLDEIKAKVEQIGMELNHGGRYHLSVTGEGLGGGIATAAAFFLASDPSLELASAVRVFTFASSRVGCRDFSHAFQHLEETGRLQHARFITSNDIKCTLPMPDEYHHVGLQIRLHTAGRQRARQSLDVNYNYNDRRLSTAFAYVLSFFSFASRSSVSEYQHRLHSAREYRLALSNGGALGNDEKSKRLKSLNDYYLMKCRLSDFLCVKDRSSMPSVFMFVLVSCLISVEIALVFKFVADW